MTSIGGRVIPYFASKLPPQTAGNDADVEDNAVITPVSLDFNAIKKKLRWSAPKECCHPTTPCKLQDEREEAKKSRMPSATDRLTARPRSAVEMVGDVIEKPKGAVPPLALPYWHCLPLDNKLPFLPSPPGVMYYTPGKVSEKLQRAHKVYSVQDPYNRERIVRYPYSAVYDPNAKNFVSNPSTKKLLHSRGIINELDDIIVPLGKFNAYRDYLKTLHTDELHLCFREEDELYKKEREQIQHINRFLNEEEGKAAERLRKIEKARRLKQAAQDYKASRLHKKEQRTMTRLEALARDREQARTDKMLRNAEKGRILEQKRRALEKKQRKHMLKMLQQSVMKGVKSAEKRNQDLESIKKANENYMMEWIDTKINQSQARRDKEQNISRSWRETLKAKGNQRQTRVETLRADLPNITERRKQEKERRLGIVRKYFYIWLNKTRQQRRRNSTIDNSHTSLWFSGTSGSLDNTLDFLRFQSGTETKLDEFIKKIVKLKAAIREQLALEAESELNEEEESDEAEEVLTLSTEISKSPSLLEEDIRSSRGSSRKPSLVSILKPPSQGKLKT